MGEVLQFLKKIGSYFVLAFFTVILAGCKKTNFPGVEILDYDKWVSAAVMYCENEGGEVQDWYEGSENQQVCSYDDGSYCNLRDLFDKKCGKGEMYDWGGEWITVVTDMCNEEGGEIQQWNEGGETQDVCYFSDESFCYLEDLAADICHKGDMKYYDDNLYAYAEQACFDNNGQISQTENGEDICILNDEEFCYMSDVMDGACDLLYQDMLDIQDMHEDERLYQEYIAECYEQPQITVCGEDGNSYYNRCFMEKAGVQEETELAEIVDGECVFG